VLVENYRAGVLARLGFDWDTCTSCNPALVYCAISGFGQDGPMSQAPGLRPDHPGPVRHDEHHRHQETARCGWAFPSATPSAG
jgi:hypothetical protein